MPLDSGEIAQLTDVQPRKRDPRDTDSQKFIKAEETKLIEHTRIEAEKKKKAEEKDKAHALPKFELADRQSATDLQLSPDGKHVFMLVVERAEAAKRPNVPNYVTESSYTEDIPARTFVGDAQDKRSLAVLNLDTGKIGDRGDGWRGHQERQGHEGCRRRQGRQGHERQRCGGACRCCPTTARSPSRTCARPTTRIAGWSPSIPRPARSACSTRCTTTRGCAKSAGSAPVDPSFGLLPDQKHVWFLSERDGWMHLYTVDATAAQPAARQLTQGKWEIDDVELSADQKKFYITSTEVHPGERHIYAMSIDGGARTKLTSMIGGTTRRSVARRQHVRPDLLRRAPSRTRST